MKKVLTGLLIGSGLFLVGCGNDDVEQMPQQEAASETLPSDDAQIVLDILEDSFSSRTSVRESLISGAGFSDAEARMIVAEVGNFISWDYQAVRAVRQLVDTMMESETEFVVDEMRTAVFMLLEGLDFDLDEIDYGLAYFNALFD